MEKRYRKESWIDPRIEIKSSPLHGKGMFAVASIRKGEVVVIWGLPKTYKYKEDAEKAAANGRAKGKSIIVGQLDEDLFTVEERGDDPTYFMNHSCDSNVWMKDEVTLIARRDIKPNEELTLDYALTEADEDHEASWKCVCGSPMCRRRYTGKDWRIPELQERYLGHFTPLINKRIAKLKETRSK
jgi:SET domain-containing protein